MILLVMCMLQVTTVPCSYSPSQVNIGERVSNPPHVPSENCWGK